MNKPLPPAPAACSQCYGTRFTEKMGGYVCDGCCFFHPHYRPSRLEKLQFRAMNLGLQMDDLQHVNKPVPQHLLDEALALSEAIEQITAGKKVCDFCEGFFDSLNELGKYEACDECYTEQGGKSDYQVYAEENPR